MWKWSAYRKIMCWWCAHGDCYFDKCSMVLMVVLFDFFGQILFPYAHFIELFNRKISFPPCGLYNCGNRYCSWINWQVHSLRDFNLFGNWWCLTICSICKFWWSFLLGIIFSIFQRWWSWSPQNVLTILHCLYSLDYFCTAALRMWSFNVWRTHSLWLHIYLKVFIANIVSISCHSTICAWPLLYIIYWTKDCHAWCLELFWLRIKTFIELFCSWIQVGKAIGVSCVSFNNILQKYSRVDHPFLQSRF